MNLTRPETIAAIQRLEQAGIWGSDATTSLHRIQVTAPPALDYRAWLASLAGRSPTDLLSEYGTDAIRAVLTLRSLNDDGAHNTPRPVDG